MCGIYICILSSLQETTRAHYQDLCDGVELLGAGLALKLKETLDSAVDMQAAEALRTMLPPLLTDGSSFSCCIIENISRRN